MKSSDRTILVALGVIGLFAAFWFLAVSPKRGRASELDTQIASLQQEVASQQAVVAEGQQAQADYQRNYSSLVVLGKAAPADGDTPSLLEQLVHVSDTSGTSFESLSLGTPATEQTAPAPVPTAPSGAPTSTSPSTASTTTSTSTTTTSTAVPAAPTEAAVSTLPIGATVGSAGLGILPYDMKFTGSFFQIADLFQGMDKLIGSKNVSVDVGGRLITVNSFKMTKPDAVSPLDVELSISSYVLPEAQGLTAGGTSTMPPASVPAATPTPVSTTTPAPATP